MLRRVAHFVRRMLFVAGIAMLVGWPASYAIQGLFKTSGPGETGLHIRCVGGVVEVMYLEGFEKPFDEASLTFTSVADLRKRSLNVRRGGYDPRAFRPEPFVYRRIVNRLGATMEVSLPLWLPAVLALIWPMIALLQRRRPPRGFAVEPLAAPEVAEASETGTVG